ncbi:MAG: tRNA epoxyqueuosine(34) reductase QueG [Phycisphaerales bacterium]|nr:tRNA epoxyqueuosine(34) reductase QueG [Phycisphaerales bacterium]
MSSSSQRQPSQPILDCCREAGFPVHGIADATESPTAPALRDWLESGKQGEMKWMGEHVAVRIDPRVLVPDARSVIVVADRYGGDPDDSTTEGRGRIARYARGRDYHRYMKKRLHQVADRLSELHPGETFRACVDTAPVLEREVAAAAGLGAIGKHTLLIQPGVGSWMLLGEIVTTLAIEPTTNAVDRPHDPCGTCTRCIDACPTDAITPWSVDARKCISYLTIEHRTSVDPSFHEGIGEWLFGCDICQEVCPHNQPTELTRNQARDAEYEGRPRPGDVSGASLDVLEVLGWTEEDRRDAFVSSSMKRAKLDMIRRNAVIVAGNLIRQGDESGLLQRLRQLAASMEEPALVRDTAVQVLGQLDEASEATED